MRLLSPILALALASCAGEGVVPVESTLPPEVTMPVEPGDPCAGWGRPEVVGRVADPGLGEVSGMVASRAHPGILWVHNDSDGGPLLWALDPSGNTVATLELTGAEAVDWEAAALGPGPGADYLYVADTGDNLKSRPHAVLYRVAEPAEPAGAREGEAGAVRFTYPGGPEDVEAMFVDPETGDAYLIGKVLLGPAPVYRVPASAWARGEAVAERVATLELGLFPATAADLSADGRVLAVRTYASVLLLARPAGAPIAALFDGRPCRAPAPPETQGEALTWEDGSYVTIGEGVGSPVYRISR